MRGILIPMVNHIQIQIYLLELQANKGHRVFYLGKWFMQNIFLVRFIYLIFHLNNLENAILDFSRRRRRFGGNDDLSHFNFDPKLVANLELKWWRLGKIPEGVKFSEYAIEHIRKQFGLSKTLGTKAAKYALRQFFSKKKKNGTRQKFHLKSFINSSKVN